MLGKMQSIRDGWAELLESGRAQTVHMKLRLLSPLCSPAPMKSWYYGKTQLVQMMGKK